MVLARSQKESSYQSISLEENYHYLTTTLKEYANQGLRTLVMAVKDLSESQYQQMLTDINSAETVMENRDEVKAAWYDF